VTIAERDGVFAEQFLSTLFAAPGTIRVLSRAVTILLMPAASDSERIRGHARGAVPEGPRPQPAASMSSRPGSALTSGGAMRAVDTNVLVRLVVGADVRQAQAAEAFVRQVAARAATTLAAYALVAGGLPLDSAAFLGAAHVR
jgi:hypothetical protein